MRYVAERIDNMDWSYQEHYAKMVFKHVLDRRLLAGVLAACPSSGKTTISHMIINKYLKIYPNAKVVVLTEGQNTLKDQYLEELEDANVDIDFTYGVFGSDKQVQVGIPQSIHNLKIDTIDLLVVDECQNYFLEEMDQKIIKKYKVKH